MSASSLVVVVNAARLARIPGRPGVAAGGDAASPRVLAPAAHR
jgi:hypothetical protein